MKTLKFISILCGVICFNLAYSFTSQYLPIDGVYENPVDKLLVFNNPEFFKDFKKIQSKSEPSPNLDDTIVINLDEVVISNGFPGQSQACLQQRVIYPDFALQQNLEGVVVATILFNDSGNIEIVESYGSDPRLKNYVLEKLLDLHLKCCSVQMFKEYNLRFTFRIY